MLAFFLTSISLILWVQAALLYRQNQPDEVTYVAITALVATLGFL